MTAPDTNSWAVRRLTERDAGFDAALHLALLGRERQANQPRHVDVAHLLADVAAGPLKLELMHAAHLAGEMRGAAFAVKSPDGSGLVHFSSESTGKDDVFAAGMALGALAEAAWVGGYVLLEVLLPTEVTAFDGVLERAGFRRITTLKYLSRGTAAEGPGILKNENAVELTWVTFAEDLAAMFVEAIDRSAAQSMDCPELTTIRSGRAALAAHRSVGVFDPKLWHMALRGGEPVGVALLSRMRRAPVAEVVYMGVAQPARGTGVADALLRKASSSARSVGASHLALAVDARNEPAMRLYRRWRFVEVGERSAHIATPVGVES